MPRERAVGTPVPPPLTRSPRRPPRGLRASPPAGVAQELTPIKRRLFCTTEFALIRGDWLYMPEPRILGGCDRHNQVGKRYGGPLRMTVLHRCQVQVGGFLFRLARTSVKESDDL